ncbi:hypothetical protein A1O1_05590 [Capronia coronata CBS 617.96]|uniref:Uncharacterized protein n=1 Tax=Capronia coronata CBS 617.96 TaxID=1182541 RepID=W9Z2B5_9EURO|nr:uncharacterized protein A1O1_05590 [Capronia coronata CBS 617.96]EXJ88659.1 hypothetical protein A1O1_05590 [Capronia coronata CBS 617.96]
MDQPEESSRFTTENYIDLMTSHGISFEGRIRPDKWGDYAAVFDEIRRIGQLRPEEFADKFLLEDEYAVDKAYNAARMSEEAWGCLENGDSDRICRKRPWKPMFEAKPANPVEAERLQRRRRKRLLCTCTRLELAQTRVRSSDQYSRLFSRQFDKSVDHEDMTSEAKKRLKRRPDRVIGLRPTGTLRQHLPSLQTRYSPFKRRNVVYPFIVIEAKPAENHGASFASMLRQTAFVTRTCLRLQQNLRQETGMPHQCLVWSFLSLGEEWRLYAAVPDGLGVQIFDLWHGTVLFPEGGLQLLLIIEHLCDWACEVYRPSVLTCLSGGRDNLLRSRLSPTGTDISSQLGDADLTLSRAASRAISLPSRSSVMRELAGGTTTGRLPKDTSAEPPEIELLLQVDSAGSLRGQDSHRWRRWATKAQDSSLPWTGKATIRHANQVELSFVQVTVPAKAGLLERCLAYCFPELTPKGAARKLLISLQDDDLAVTAPAPHPVKAAFQQRTPQSRRSTLEVRALVYFRSAISPEDWQVTRHVLAVLCDQQALRLLAETAEEVDPKIDRDMGMGMGMGMDRRDAITTSADWERFKQAINWPKYIGGTTSAGLALGRRQLCLRSLRDDDGSVRFEWTKFCPQQDGGVAGEDMLRMISWSHASSQKPPQVGFANAIPHQQLAPYLQTARCTLTVTVQANTDAQRSATPAALAVPNLRTSGVLIKKPTTGWPETVQEFCYLVTDEKVGFDDVALLGQLLEETRRRKELYSMVRKHTTYHQRDLAFIDRWIRVLKNELPHDTPFSQLT